VSLIDLYDNTTWPQDAGFFWILDRDGEVAPSLVYGGAKDIPFLSLLLCDIQHTRYGITCDNRGWIRFDEVEPPEGMKIIWYDDAQSPAIMSLGDQCQDFCATHWQPAPYPPVMAKEHWLEGVELLEEV